MKFDDQVLESCSLSLNWLRTASDRHCMKSDIDTFGDCNGKLKCVINNLLLTNLFHIAYTCEENCKKENMY